MPHSLPLRKLPPMHTSRIPGPGKFSQMRVRREGREVRDRSLWQLWLHTQISPSGFWEPLSALTPSGELGGLLVWALRYFTSLLLSLYLCVKNPSTQRSSACPNRSGPFRTLNKKIFFYLNIIETMKDVWRPKLQTPPKVLLNCYRLSFQQATSICLIKYYLSLSDDKQNE